MNSSPAELADAIGQLGAIAALAHRDQLLAIAAYDDARLWEQDGATSMSSWLAGWMGLSHDSASEWVRVGHALKELPSLSDTYANGRLSWDQVRAVTRFATPETDETLAEEAPKFSAAMLWRVARRHRPVTTEEDQEDHRLRELRFRWEFGQQSVRINGRLPAAEGSVVMKAIERIVEQAPRDNGTKRRESYVALSADALVELASARLAADGDADRATVGVHIDAAVLAGADGMAELDTGAAVSSETARRLACDARWYVVADGPDGTPVGIGRVSRQVPAWLSREVKHRDLTCRFPGCNRTRWLAAHHLVHWGQGGPTDLDNLVMICGTHHRLVHEGGWKISGDPNGDIVFIAPDGRNLTQGPPPLRDEIKQRLRGDPVLSRPPP
jgi:uncharacterized protein DUF222/HNH endonuclease